MSTAPRQPYTPPPSDDIYPEDAFDEYIWDNPEVCNECFSRPVEVEVPTEDAPEVVADLRYWGEEGDLDTIPVDVDEYGVNVVDRPMTVCKNCGSTSLRVHSESLSRRQAMLRVPRLIERLEEQDVRVHKKMVSFVVRKGKQRRTLQGHDREIFELAVKKGVEYARCR